MMLFVCKVIVPRFRLQRGSFKDQCVIFQGFGIKRKSKTFRMTLKDPLESFRLGLEVIFFFFFW